VSDASPSPSAFFSPQPSGSTPNVGGQIVVVTGATRGIGRAAAMRFAQLGAEVVLVGRDERKLDEVRVEAKRLAANDRVFWVRADYASLASVRAAGEEIAHRWPAIHVLVNNAGVNSARRTLSADGYEMTYAVNHLAPFLLTALLVPALAKAAPSRIVEVTSIFTHLGRVDMADPNFERRRYDSTRAYTQSKLANTVTSLELADRVEGMGITVNCVSPGLVATDLLREHWLFSAPPLRGLWRKVLLSPEQAAERIVRVATSPTLANVTGQCFAATDRAILTPRRARDSAARRALWDASARLTRAPELAPARRSR
jgi:NAD(P)-dependent dehydrogenase (short-subunit alcohol dehydrogenase family)